MAALLRIGQYVWIPSFQRQRALELLKSASKNYGRLYQGRFNPPWRTGYQGSPYSASQSYTRGRVNWNRKRLPVYGSFASNIPMSRVYVPGTITFPWENELDLWDVLPLVRYSNARNQSIYQSHNMPVPDKEVWISLTPGGPRGGPPEHHRRRHDSKVPGWYNRLLSVVGRTYGRYSEYGDFASAFYYNKHIPGIATALALNNAIDYAFGRRAQFLKDNVYGKYWNLPIGIDAVSRLWR